MNYYEARKRTDNGKWAYTGMNDGRIWTEPCCDPGMGPASEHHQHDTAEEAERCHYEYETANARFDGKLINTQHKCEFPGCGEWTDREAQYGHGLMRSAMLCDAHRNLDGLRAANPFSPGVREVSSY